MSKPWEHGVLRVSDNHRYLMNGETPFFWLADTAWLMFKRLSPEEARIYMTDRKAKGFNVIMSTFIHGVSAGNGPDYQTFINESVDKVISPENLQYWEHIDKIVDIAEELGLYMGLLPCWGAVMDSGQLNKDNLDNYIDFLIKRFANRKNIVWLTGGDTRADISLEEWNRMGERLKNAMPEMLVGYHPFGRTSSSYWYHEKEWLDFNMFQSGHRRYDQESFKSGFAAADNKRPNEPWYGEDNWRYVLADHAKSPLKPVVDGEPSYEDLPQGLHDGTQPRWREHHVRRYAYWAVLAGAFGHSYGHNSIMQFWDERRNPGFSANKPWKDSLFEKGSGQMQFLKELMEELDFVSGLPAQHLLTDEGEKESRILAFETSKAVIVYNYLGRSFALTKPAGERDIYWVDPADNARTYIGREWPKDGIFTPPVKPNGHNDWVLLLEKPGGSFTL